MTVVSPAWLALREPADAAARSLDLVAEVRRRLPPRGPLVVHDLGSGTGSMRRWLAPQLPGPQHWVMSDRDGDLLAAAAADPPGMAADGSAVTGETRHRDITGLEAGDLAGAALVTASALLDMLTGEEAERIVSACVAARCPALVSISVIGRVDLTPSDALDEYVADAFNAHQRRAADGRRLLGPDAVAVAAGAFRRLGADVLLRPSPWRLGAAEPELAAEWFTGWLVAARQQRPDLATATAAYACRRLDDAAAGRLRITVHHQDLLALPR